MNNTNGLEGLAAIASVVASSSGRSTAPSAQEASSNNNSNRDDDTASHLEKASDSTKTTSPSDASSTQPTAPMNQPASTTASGSLSATQWQQLTAAATNLNQLSGAAPPVNPATTAPNLALLATLQQLGNQGGGGDPTALLALQQKLNYFHLLAQAQQQQQMAPTHPTPAALDPNSMAAAQALSFALQGQQLQQQVMPALSATNHFSQGSQSVQNNKNNNIPTTSNSTNSMPPPAMVNSISVASNPSTFVQPTTIAPRVDSGGEESIASDNLQEKKHQKRAANRRSAQLSRKRKKQFIEELKEENDSLRRKEQILKSIPDLIVVFDSSGKLWFVSQSVSRFLQFTASELEGTSFWSRLCENSVRLLKAAFMDSLAARQPNSDTAALGQEVWELRLVDKDGSQKLVTLNGVVHFAGDRPECVCSIRPKDELATENTSEKGKETVGTAARKARMDEASSSFGRSNGKEAIRISDSGNSFSGSSDSGSSDEMIADVEQATKAGAVSAYEG